MKIAVAGGTGLVGRLVVEQLAEAGHESVVLARSTGFDLTSGAGLAEAVQGCDVIIDVSNIATQDQAESEAFFTATVGNLLAAAGKAGVRHLLVLSIVGSDLVDFGYYLGKRRQEQLVTGGDVPWTILRATQFHQFAEQFLAGSDGPAAQLPRMLCQPVAAREVAAELVRLAGGEPRGMATPLGGPEQLVLADMCRQVLAAQGSDRQVVEFELPGPVGEGLANGNMCPKGEFTAGTQTFAEHCAQLKAAAA
ncbi:MAG TPA: NAD(P)H-binding protein [Jatrophihabitans sp.]|nr:NAD(P)H-binding protein [Jatrophihabitans sp.]